MGNQIIENMITSTKKRMDFLIEELRTCPKGLLREQRIKGKTYYLQIVNENENRKRFGISKEYDKICGLIKKTFYEDELNCLTKNYKILTKIQSSITDFDFVEEFRNFKKLCPSITDEMIKDALKSPQQKEWEDAEYEQCNYKPEEKKHITSRGLHVRSKSEVLIAEKLYEHNIEFRYEQAMRIKGKLLAPDFTIMRSDGKKFIWEHEGLTSVQAYMERQLEKSQLYASVGIVPWDNFIVTYDDENGNIDLRIVESEIQNKLLV